MTDGKAPKKRRKSSTFLKDVLFVLFTLVCFPVGLYLLWTKKKYFPLSLRVGITAFVGIFVIAALLIALPENLYGHTDVEFVNVSRDGNVYMPEVPDHYQEGVVSYKNAYSADSVIVQPDPTAEPIHVWCNDMGKYYHVETCRYVKDTTPRVTLTKAAAAGFQPCPDCHPPKY